MQKKSNSLSPQAAYDQWADTYDDADPTTLLDEPFLLLAVQPFSGCRILDLGCGTGRYLRLVTQPGVSIVGMDLSRGMLARARRTVIPTGPVAWVQASLEQFPFPNGTFDRVISGLVLDHVNDIDAYFRRVAAVLQPGGRLVLSAVHPEMQRQTGPAVRFTVQGHEYQTRGAVHEVQTIAAAAQGAGLIIEKLLEPSVDQELVARCPSWSDRLGCPALVLLMARTAQ